MKNIILTAFLILSFVFVSNAQQYDAYNGMLRVKLADRTPISLNVDGRYFQQVNRVVTIGHLPVGEHYIKIYTGVSGRGDRDGLIFEGKVNIDDNALTVFTLDAYTGNVDVHTRPLGGRGDNRPDYQDYADNQQGNYPDQQQGNNNMPLNGTYNDRRNSQPDLNAQSYQDNRQNPNGNSNNNGGYSQDNNGYNGNNNYNQNDNGSTPAASPASPDYANTISAEKLAGYKKITDKKITDTDRLKFLKSSLGNESLSTSQVISILSWLNFESSKVDFAKWAYNNTVDKDNYRSVENSFEYSSSQDELESFLSGK